MIRRRLIRLALGLLVGAVVIVGAANAVVALGGGGWTRDPAAARPAQAALVLGAQVRSNGSPSAMLEDRVRAAAALLADRAVIAGDQHLGHTAIAADARSYGSITRTLQAREVLARVKAVGDVVTGAGPRFLGPRHPIAGDGRTTLG